MADTETTATWPKKVTAQYRTIGGATVLLAQATQGPSKEVTSGECTGCTGTKRFCWSDWHGNSSHAEEFARAWAQTHAETCRAMPQPDGADRQQGSAR